MQQKGDGDKMKLTLEGLKDRKAWEKAGISLPDYEMEQTA